ncbi:hypothetical protein Barb6_00852 [Bacteroidales bacterium Barb6]|nr:hypothetical protein Barb6_00852 [Bacteroidales bacterium Barb6]
MIGDLKTTVLTAALSTLGLTAVTAELDDANEAFKTLYGECSDNLLTQKGGGTMANIRKNMDNDFKVFSNVVNVAYETNELTAKDAATRTELSQIIDVVNAIR